MDIEYSSPVSVVITSCGRPELLEKTIETFIKFNTYTIERWIVIDDSGNKISQDEVAEVMRKRMDDIGNVRMVINHKNVGQIISIDSAYHRVYTPYIFHCEDDWEFYEYGFIEKSMKILDAEPKIATVRITGSGNHPTEIEEYKIDDVKYHLLQPNWFGWHGFSFNPGLRRLKDYKQLGPYMKIGDYDNTGVKEQVIGDAYYKAGFRVAIIEQHCKHIGDGFHC